MDYKITEHYTRGVERLIAEFQQLADAQLFVIKKSYLDEVEKRNIIYRLYDETGLLQEINKRNIAVSQAKYAEGNSEFPFKSPCIFYVFLSARGALERTIIAQFIDKNYASFFIDCQFEEDNTLLDTDVFFIYKKDVLIDTLNKMTFIHRKKLTQGHGMQEKGSHSHISPLSTRPTPPGGPPDYWVEKDDDNL